MLVRFVLILFVVFFLVLFPFQFPISCLNRIHTQSIELRVLPVRPIIIWYTRCLCSSYWYFVGWIGSRWFWLNLMIECESEHRFCLISPSTPILVTTRSASFNHNYWLIQYHSSHTTWKWKKKKEIEATRFTLQRQLNVRTLREVDECLIIN